MPRRSLITTLAATLAAALAGAGPVLAADDFYQGKRIYVVSGSDVGGGYDAYARLLGRHMPSHIPGSPQFIVQNQPGAGGIKAANYIYGVARQDGTNIGGFQRAVAFVALLGQKGVQYDPARFQWLGSMNNEVGIVRVRMDVPVRSFADLKSREVLVGSSGPNDTELYPALMNNTLGTRFKIIAGYKASTEIDLAIERRELEGVSASFSSLKDRYPHWKDVTHIVVQVATKKHPELPDIPLIYDYITDADTKALWDIALSQKVMGRPFALGPKVPAARVALLRAAYDATIADAAFQEEATRTRREIVSVSGTELQDMVVAMAKAPKSTFARLDQLTKYKGVKGVAKVTALVHKGRVTQVIEGGRAIAFDIGGTESKAKISASRTRLSVGGKPAKREALKAGMICEVTYPAPGEEASSIACAL